MTETDDLQRLRESRQFCLDLTKAAAKNFYYGLRLLPEPKRSAMFALYAYMRLVDDIADEEDGRSPDRRAADLDVWRSHTNDALCGRVPVGCNGDARLWSAFMEMARSYRVPAHLFDDAITGQQRDLWPERFETFEQLRQYCYQVAGVVGVASIHIWGFEGGAETEALAAERGIALQLTNILRDLREDAARGRIYLPLEDLAAAGVGEEDLLRGRGGEAFCRLMRAQITRAESYYENSRGLEARVAADARPTLIAMTDIYHRLLRKVAEEPERVLSLRVSLSPWSKMWIGWRAARASRAVAAAAAAAATTAAATAGVSQ
jgi:15-cis-phytoene synthase